MSGAAVKVLLIGSGAREHAMAWKLLQSTRVRELFVAPGNAAMLAQLENEFPEKSVELWQDSIQGDEALKKLAARAREAGVGFVAVGPDNALADGAVDIFNEAGLPAFGPSKAAAQIESSKIFSKRLMAAAKVPTAAFHEAHSLNEAESVVRKLDWKTQQWVLKADGLALGKGVEICETMDEALEALHRLKAYSEHFVIEERLRGKEISWLGFCDGETCALLPPAQDYKTLTEDPLSPNTGGMGAVCPVPVSNSRLIERVKLEVFLPVLQEMKRRGTPYRGILYAGLMVHEEKFWVLEFNARFGDPEAQVLLPLIDVDILEWFEASAAGTLTKLPAQVPVKNQAAVYVCAAAKGYPGTPVKGTRISGIETWLKTHHGFFAGVKKQPNGEFVTDGGRVLGALGIGPNLSEARRKAFAHLGEISFEGMQVRQGVGAEWA